MPIVREIEPILKNLFKSYPVVTITGPRQSGKTTLTRMSFPDLPYVNFELPSTRELASSDPIAFMRTYKDGAIIDEFQNVPDIVSYIQAHVDELRKNSLFVLTGSEQLTISNKVSQSLAGRTGLLRLLPFSIKESDTLGGKRTINEMIYGGFYPRLLDQKLEANTGYEDYIETYIERDLRQISELKNLSLFKKFMRLCAGRIGQLLNLNNMADDIGVSHTTLRHWLSVMEASYIIFLAQPFYRQLPKRLVKTPKIYFYDVGLASSLMGITNSKQLIAHPLRGQLFENLVIAEVLKTFYNQGKKNEVFFYRDKSGTEVDLLLQINSKWIAIEIKASETFHSDFIKNLNCLDSLLKNTLYKKYVVYSGKDTFVHQNSTIISPYSLQTELIKMFGE